MSKLWICEKPSQAESLANELGNKRKSQGFIKTDDGIVTWCFGHLLHLAPPEHYDPSLKYWAFSKLPVMPSQWVMQASQDTQKQLNIIGELLTASEEVVISTDGDREGEAIGRNVLSHFGFTGIVKRLWLGALDPVSIQRALCKILDGSETLALYHAAEARNRADWLIGMNGTMAATVKFSQKGVVSLGRVQTPTLAMIVNRDLAIDKFKTRKFYDFIGHFQIGDNTNFIKLKHSPSNTPEDNRVYSENEAKSIKERLENKDCVFSVECVRKKKSPPKLFSLSGLQIETNKKWGWSADKTLKLAQSLYETHKVSSYPRSDCTYLPAEQTGDVKGILKHLQSVESFSDTIIKLADDIIIRDTVFNTKKVTAHHAIIPTLKSANFDKMNDDEAALYLLISTHFIASLMSDYEYDETMISTSIDGKVFKQSYSFTKIIGWCSLIPNSRKDAEGLPEVSDGANATLNKIELDKKETTPPKRYTEALLIKDMTNIAKYVDDEDHKSILKETSGIGTEATRASIIKTLKDREVIIVKGKSLISTASGRDLIEALPDSVTSAVETALWEDQLTAIADGTGAYGDFMSAVQNKVQELLTDIDKASQAGVRINAEGKTRPSEAMIATVEKLVGLTGQSCENYKNDIVVCRNYMDTHADTLEENKGVPSEKAIQFVEKIAELLNIELPEDYTESSASCSSFISEHKNKMPSLPASEAQVKFAEKIAKHKKEKLDEEVRLSAQLCSEYINENKSCLPKKKFNKNWKKKGGKK